MFLIKKIKTVCLLAATVLLGNYAFGQIEAGNAYAIGNFVNVAVDGERGKEGTDAGAGFNFRGGAPGVPCGFVADPGDTGWDAALYDGDFFTPGSPENGWGIQIAGTDYNNNYNVYDVIVDPGFPTHSIVGECITIEWQGQVAGVVVNVKYHLVLTELFYTTEITLVNNSGGDLTDVYYFRNVDPDNNQPLSGSFETTNTIVSQPGTACQKSLVSAEQSTPHDSYLGFGALGPNFRVCHGGFSNRDGDDIWNATGFGFDGAVGSSVVADAAISIAYKTDIVANDTANFTFAVVLSAAAVEGAFSSLYYIDYSTVGTSGGGLISQCNPTVDTAKSCAGNPVTLSVDGPNAPDYSWAWTSLPLDAAAPTSGAIIDVAPSETTTYSVVGTPISTCLTSTISKTIVVEFSEGPELSITDPGPYCVDFDITTLVFEDLNSTSGTVTAFFSECPDSAKQTSPIYPGPLMGPDDEVWLMIGDTAGGCFDKELIEIDFGGLGAAGLDSSIALCGSAGVTVDLHDLITPGANPLGSFVEVTSSGQFNASSGILTVGGLGGVYEFTYTVIGEAPCPNDNATFLVEVYPEPTARFEYEVGALSSATGLESTCIVNEVDFVNETIIPTSGVIASWNWNFGDFTSSTLENPSHLYTTPGNYTITLTVVSTNGCVSVVTKEIEVYTEPVLSVILNSPTCFGFSDGSITGFIGGGSGTFSIEIKDEDDNILNVSGSNTANTLSAGTYYVNVVDGSGCEANQTIILTNPEQLLAFYTITEPNCFGELGAIKVDSVRGENINNAISYFWAPETDVPNGFNADSVNVIEGEYVLTVNDSKGCSNVTTITMTEPTEFVFAEFGHFPAYCRLFDYQSGNGEVFASATGGTGDATTPQWTYLEDPTQTAAQGTWGGRNPGDYQVYMEDENGCVLVDTITVDSLSPIADFTVTSEQLNADCKGTASVDAIFTNASQYYENPKNPSPDPVFFWNLDTLNTKDTLIKDFNQTLDTTYGARGDSYIVQVCLTTQNTNGCSDKYCKPIEIFEPIEFTGINVFSPNGDGVNDQFTFSFSSASISEFKCVIVNRWGVRVGEILNIETSWDGTDFNGDPCTDGVYFYTYEATADNGEKFQGQSSLQIITGK